METKFTTLIERYFDELLSPEDIRKVEQLKNTDSDFLKEFELFEKSHQAIKLSTIINLKAEIKEIHKRMDGSAKSNKVIQFWWGRVAASIIILVGVGIGFYAQKFSNQNLYDESYTLVGDYITNMDEELSEMEIAMQFFDKQQFDLSTQLFDKIYTATGDQIALFYTGHSHYQAGRMEQAIKSLNDVSNNYQPEAQWYVALAYLKMEDTVGTIRTLEYIISNNQDKVYVLKAKKLADKLRSPLRMFTFL